MRIVGIVAAVLIVDFAVLAGARCTSSGDATAVAASESGAG